MSLSGLAQRLPRLWYRRTLAIALYPLLPLSWLFHLLVGMRQVLYRLGVLHSHRLPVPVVVVGNLTVGGNGKTPLVLWLVERLRDQGWQPGIISRGYGGTGEGVQAVATDAQPLVVGDEPLLLAQRSGVPVFIGRDRVAAGQALLAAHPDCDVIISDDGLQHYRLQRTVELVVFDGRAAGNSRLLPAGPLREPLRRLSTATAIVWNSVDEVQQPVHERQARWERCAIPQFAMCLTGEHFESLANRVHRCSADNLRGQCLYAMAGIGNPPRFFAQLRALGLEFEAHPFPDHQQYSAQDLAFARDGVLLMTEKDAVKCAALTMNEAWVLPVAAQIAAASDGKTLLDTILEKLDGRPPA